MTPILLLRLALDLVAVSLLVAAMVYSWLGNVAHEVAGTAMFALLVLHNVFNRRWYGTLAKRRPGARGIVTRTINLSLLATMMGLLVTSVVISQSVFAFLPIATTFTARQLHAMAAYLVLLVAAVHLGLHWSMIMTAARRPVGIATDSRVRSVGLAGVAIVIAACGAWSLPAMDIPSKLLMEAPTGFGDFGTPTSIVLLRHVAVVGLLACIAHYALRIATRRRRGSDR